MTPTRTPSPCHLRLQGLDHGWAGVPPWQEFCASLGPGLTLVLGGDGAGKSTLLRFISGRLTPARGQVCDASGTPVSGEWLRQRVCWIDPNDPSLAAHDQTPARAALARELERWPMADHAALPALCEALGLTPHLDKPVFMLSTGSRRKVWLATALCAQAPLTLLETPLAALDVPSGRLVTQTVMARARRGGTWLWADYEAPPDLQAQSTLWLGPEGG